MDTERTQRVKLVMSIAGGLSLVLLPLILMLAFGLHFDSLADFFAFKLKYESRTTRGFMDILIGPDAARLFIVPHVVGYLGLPFLMSTALTLSYILFGKKPWLALAELLLVYVLVGYCGLCGPQNSSSRRHGCGAGIPRISGVFCFYWRDEKSQRSIGPGELGVSESPSAGA